RSVRRRGLVQGQRLSRGVRRHGDAAAAFLGLVRRRGPPPGGASHQSGPRATNALIRNPLAPQLFHVSHGIFRAYGSPPRRQSGGSTVPYYSLLSLITRGLCIPLEEFP